MEVEITTLEYLVCEQECNGQKEIRPINILNCVDYGDFQMIFKKLSMF